MHTKIIALTLTGTVQGVFFRTSAQAKAQSLSLTGFVRNQPDGGVYLEAQGTQKSLDEFIAWCKTGPRHAQVNQITTKSIDQFSENLEPKPGNFLIL